VGQVHLLAQQRGGVVALVPAVFVEVDHLTCVHAGALAPVADLVDGVEAAGGLQLREGAAVGVHVHHDLPLGELQRAVVAGEVAGGHGPANVQRLLAPQTRESLRTGGDGVVEVQGVGEVEGAAHVDGAVEGHLVGVDVEAPAVGRRLAAGFGFDRVEPDPGLLHHPLQLGERELRRGRGDVDVHEPGTLERQREGGLGDLAGLPHRHPAGHDPRPEPGEPVAGLDRLTQVGPSRVRELGDTELGTNGAPSPAIGQLTLPHRGGTDRVDRVHRRPLGSQLELLGLGTIRDASTVAGGGQHRGRGVEIGGGCHTRSQALTTDSQTPRTRLYTGF
jgi:hypothetical protein